MELIDALDRTFQHAHAVIAAVDPKQYGDPTPCEEWSVRQLLEHIISVPAGLGAAVTGGEAYGSFELSDDPAAQFETVAKSALEAWRGDGALDRSIQVGPGPMPGRAVASINLVDTATHTWDLATATGQPAELPDDIASAVLEASHQIVTPQLRPGRFHDALDAPAGATVTQQLVTFLGRKP